MLKFENKKAIKSFVMFVFSLIKNRPPTNCDSESNWYYWWTWDYKFFTVSCDNHSVSIYSNDPNSFVYATVKKDGYNMLTIGNPPEAQ